LTFQIDMKSFSCKVGTDEDHVHLLVQSIPTLSIDNIVTTIKSRIARQVFKEFPPIKEELRAVTFRSVVITQIPLVNLAIKTLSKKVADI